MAMADGKPFFGAKAYKDSKVCNMMTVSELHRRYHASTGINFSSMYPGCIAETALFREKRPWFRRVRTCDARGGAARRGARVCRGVARGGGWWAGGRAPRSSGAPRGRGDFLPKSGEVCWPVASTDPVWGSRCRAWCFLP